MRVLFSYYVKMDPYSGHALHSTWSKPQQFAQLIRNAGAFAAQAGGVDEGVSGNGHHNEYDNDSSKKYTPKTKTIFESNDEEDDDYGEIVEEEDRDENYDDDYDDDDDDVAEEIEEDC
jgi:hypothetical protein